tara:strand:+ start:381 stop:587 length:207 start_codon:yes stop_codon:yes gene_type:complete
VANFVDPQFVDLLLSRLHELENHHEQKILGGSVETIEEYKLFRGQLEGIRIAIREIREVSERVFVEQN